MTTGQPKMFLSAIGRLFDKLHDWVDDDHYMVLLDSGWTPALTHSTFADISAHEVGDADYGPQDVTGETKTTQTTTVKIDHGDVSFGASVTITARYAAVLEGTAAGKAAADHLVYYLLLDDTPADVSTTSAAFSVSLDSAGVFVVGNTSSVTVSGAGSFVEPDWSGLTAPTGSVEPWLLSPSPADGADVSHLSIGSGVVATAENDALDPVYLIRSGDPDAPYLLLPNRDNHLNFTPLNLTNAIGKMTVALVVNIPENETVDADLIFVSTGTGTSAARARLTIRNVLSKDVGPLEIAGRRLDSDSESSATSASAVLDRNRWHVVVAEWDWSARTATVYVDGTQVAQTTTLGAASGNTDATDALAQRLGESIASSYGYQVQMRAAYFWTGTAPSVADIGTQLAGLITDDDGDTDYTSSTTVTVPAGATHMTARVWGGGGGGAFASAGGGGAYVAGSVPVTPGETITIDVGTGGGAGSLGGTYVGGTPGGGDGNSAATYGGGGGGGYSAVSKGGTYYLVAGGGGGAGTSDANAANGGAAGIASASDGTDISGVAGSGGGGATDSAGGAAGVSTNNGNAGSSLQGGDAYAGSETDGAGGGGGGWYGGGGGANNGADGAGGGGGSSYVHTDVIDSVSEAASGATPGGNPPAANSGGGSSSSAGEAGLVRIYWNFS